MDEIKLHSSDAPYYNAFNLLPEIGPVRFTLLKKFFTSMEAAWKASEQELLSSGLEERVVARILGHRAETDPEAEMEKLDRENIRITLISDDDYPPLLKEIFRPPPLLYTRGQVMAREDVSLAVVGSRKMTSYGKRAAEELASALAHAGVIVVSGLAYGIDACGHTAALAAGGRTIAVLPACVDEASVYPHSHRLLARHIAEQGTLLSEYPLGTLPLKQNFPSRNRIIAGLCLGTLVVEADSESGALITAKHALEQNRDVFAVPGNRDQIMSAGANDLIKRGAKLVTDVQDILDALNVEQVFTETKMQHILPDTPEEGKILDSLSREPLHIDDLVVATGLSSAQINASLTMMEMKGKVRNIGNQAYTTVR